MLARILEPELMDTAEDAHEYDAMDHSVVNAQFVTDLLEAISEWSLKRSAETPTILQVLDLGAGTAQIPIELLSRSDSIHVTAVDAAGQRLVTNLTREQIKDAPGAERAWPVSRQRERELAVYYAYPYYWAGPYRWGPTPYPMAGSAVDAPTEPPPHAERARDEPSLRSVREVLGYAITATDGDLGHVEDMLVDEASWAIRYLIVDPRSWWPGPHVIIPVDWIVGVSWSERAVRVDVTRDAVRNAPEYVAPDDAPPADDVGVGSYRSGVSRAYEERLYQHYGRPGYWARDPRFWLLMPPAA